MAKGKVGIPKPTANGSNLAAVVSKMIEVMETGEGQRGDALDAKVTWKDLRQSDLVDFAGAINPNKPLASQVIAPDPLGATPTKPTNFIASAAYTSVILEWSPAAYEGHKYTEIWRSLDNNVANAILVGQAPYSIYADVVGNDKTFYYWIRFIGTGAGNTGPYSDSHFAQTGLDIDSLLTDLTGQLTTSQLAQSLNQRLDLMDDENNVSSIAARLIQEATERSDAFALVNEELSDLRVQIGENRANISELSVIKADADSVAQTVSLLAAQIKDISIDVVGNTANIYGLEQASATVDDFNGLAESITEQINRLDSSTLDNQAAIDQLTITKAESDSVLNVTSSLATEIATLQALTSDANGAIEQLERVKATTDDLNAVSASLTSMITNLYGIAGDNRAQIQTLTEVKADNTTVNAIYELKTDVNGHVSGFGTINDGEQSQFFINADTFAILPQSGIFAAQNISSGEVETFTYNNLPYRMRQWKPLENYLSQGATQTITGVDLAGDVIAPLSMSESQTLYRCVDGGETAGVEPTWGSSIVYDGTVQWERVNTHKGPILPFVVNNNRVIINNAFINDLTADNIKVGSIGADRIASVNLSAVNGNVGELTAGVLRSGDNRFIINLNEGWLRVYDEDANERVVVGKL